MPRTGRPRSPQPSPKRARAAILRALRNIANDSVFEGMLGAVNPAMRERVLRALEERDIVSAKRLRQLRQVTWTH